MLWYRSDRLPAFPLKGPFGAKHTFRCPLKGQVDCRRTYCIYIPIIVKSNEKETRIV